MKVKSEKLIVKSEGSKVKSRRICILTSVFLFSLFAFNFSLLTAVYANDIQSRAAVVMDSATGRVLYAKNPELRLMPASTTKLMTAMVVIEKANLTDIVTVSRNAANTAPTRAGFRAGDRVTIEMLLYAALLKSANDAAVALAEAVGGSEEKFVKLMNRKALAIGANDTHFINPNGLPGKGQYITAYDLSKIMRHAIRYPVLKGILGTRITEIATETGKTMQVRNTNKLLWSDEDLLGGKTGYTNQARHCFVCAGERGNETLIVALLGSPRRDLLWKESEELMGFGARVLSNAEESVVYLTRADYDAANVTNATYTKKSGVRATKKHKGKKKKYVVKAKKTSKKKHVVTAGKKTSKKKHLAVNKKSKNKIAKNNKQKKDIAKKDNDGDAG
jgi:D-alanyl-D-alanine carboxypeptidase (penicillin-binding protein 5/6)